MEKSLKVGDTVWVFDQNRRIYPKDRQGGPIWSEHWRPEKITGETSRSWIIGNHAWTQKKLPKKGAAPFRVAYSQEEIDKAAWVHDNRYRLSHEIDRCEDYDTLKKVAELVGYRLPGPTTKDTEENK